MRRRDLIAAIAGSAAAWSLAAGAQQATIPVVEFLRVSAFAESVHLVAAFRQGLKEAGFIEGQNVTVEYRWADGVSDQLPALAADLVRRQAAVIVGHSIAVRAAMAASGTTPIIFVIGSDPVRLGLVASMNRPGGNITGVTFTTVDVTAERLGQLHELVPAAELIGS